MKKLILLLIFNYSLFITNYSLSQWVQMSNGIGTCYNVTALTSNGNYIFAGIAPTGIFVSTNNGVNWIMNAGNIYGGVYALATLNNIVYAGTTLNGVIFTSNNGNNWIQTSLNVYIYSLAVGGNKIFAGGHGVFRSTDYGNTWTQTSMTSVFINGLAILGDNVFASTSYTGVYKSSDNGNNWIQTSLNNKSAGNFAVIGNNIFVGTSGYEGVYRSSDFGETWIQTSLHQMIGALAVKDSNIFVGTYNIPSTYGGVYLTTNLGINWINRNQGFNPIPGVGELLITNGYIFAGAGDQMIWRRNLSEIIGINKISEGIPSSFNLHQNHPNPFNPMTNIKYQITTNSSVSLKIYDALGRNVETLVKEKQSPGTYEVTFDGSNLPSGIYFYRLETDNFSDVKKMILIK